MNRSKQGPTRSSKCLAVVLGLVLSGSVSAELTDQQKAIFKAAKQRSNDMDVSSLLNQIDQQKSRGAALIDETADKAAEIAIGQGDAKDEAEKRAAQICESRTHYIFASRSLGEVALREIFAEASANPETTVVFQGIPKGSKMPMAFVDLQQLAREYDPMPSVALNPLLFQEYEVTAVPEIMALTDGKWQNRKCHQEVRTRIAGITSVGYLNKRLDEGDLGQRGPVEEISEPNLMSVIAQRIKEIDWDKKKQQAVDNVWNNMQMYPLPPAPEDRIVKIDPTIEALQDIKDAEGNILVPAGKRVNPLEIQPFNSIVIVFNPMRESELAAAVEMIKAYTQKGAKIIPVLSEIDKTEGWNMYNEVARKLNHRVFMLTPDLKQRFRIMHTMSVVRASGNHFEVREVKVER
ncbi:TrbC family F-type conjugative pilus assembly protein [Marinobacter sp. F3R08]|uniref:TrbC family F-type conjugative pilus assembly protein n=1 Tax=Marinobacter sp. F3R08 TaxID=2841559 RepID=UPI001C09EA0F|nr:TrbC family F-type conjugative pilus assembly protein [Marinobacter sp. F3R08]MBU2952245.1 hypothetical protein [Marinobacter sp. F3R08]